MATPYPVILSSAEEWNGVGGPQPLVVIGGVNDAIEPEAAIANITADPGVLADLAAARTAITATNNKVNAILAALRAANIIAT